MIVRIVWLVVLGILAAALVVMAVTVTISNGGT